MKAMYDIRSETGLYHDRIAAVGERDALAQFNARGEGGERGRIVQCGRQRPYLDIDGFTFYAQRTVWINDGPDCYCSVRGCHERLVYGSCPIHDYEVAAQRER